MKTFASIVSQVSEATGILEVRIFGGQRSDDVVYAREAIFWTARKATPMSYREMEHVSNMHRGTIKTAVKRAVKRREADADFRALTDKLIQ